MGTPKLVHTRLASGCTWQMASLLNSGRHPQDPVLISSGVVIQGAGSSDAYVTSFFLQFSLDAGRWHDYREVSPTGGALEPKV